MAAEGRRGKEGKGGWRAAGACRPRPTKEANPGSGWEEEATPGLLCALITSSRDRAATLSLSSQDDELGEGDEGYIKEKAALRRESGPEPPGRKLSIGNFSLCPSDASVRKTASQGGKNMRAPFRGEARTLAETKMPREADMWWRA